MCRCRVQTEPLTSDSATLSTFRAASYVTSATPPSVGALSKNHMAMMLMSQELSSGSGLVAKQPGFTNNGDSDVSTDHSPSQFLLLRPLEPTVTEELLAKGVAKLFKPTDASSETPAKGSKKNGKVASTTGDANLGARAGSLRRVMIVRDRQSNESWRYGFAEFALVAVCYADKEELSY